MTHLKNVPCMRKQEQILCELRANSVQVTSTSYKLQSAFQFRSSSCHVDFLRVFFLKIRKNKVKRRHSMRTPPAPPLVLSILYIIAIDVFKFQVAYFGFGAPTLNSRRFSMEHRSEITSFCFGSDFFANEGSQNVFFGSQNSATF